MSGVRRIWSGHVLPGVRVIEDVTGYSGGHSGESHKTLSPEEETSWRSVSRDESWGLDVQRRDPVTLGGHRSRRSRNPNTWSTWPLTYTRVRWPFMNPPRGSFVVPTCYPRRQTCVRTSSPVLPWDPLRSVVLSDVLSIRGQEKLSVGTRENQNTSQTQSRWAPFYSSEPLIRGYRRKVPSTGRTFWGTLGMSNLETDG